MPRAKSIYTIAVPKGLSIDLLDQIENISLRDKVARLAHWLLIYTAGSKERRGRRHHWISISRARWVAHFGEHDYAEVVAKAIDVGVMECNHRYSTGQSGNGPFTKSYRLARRFHRPQIEEFRLSRKTRLKKRVITSEMDEAGIGDWLASKLPLFCLRKEARPRRVWDGVAAEAIRHAEHYATRCKYGRFHSVYTAISRYLRSGLALRSSEAPLKITDVRNSQPLTLGRLAIRSTLMDRPQSESHMCCVNVPEPEPENDVLRWLRLCEAGRLYDHLAELAGMTRIAVKNEFLPLLFDKWEATQRYSLFQLLVAEFPTMASFIESVKYKQYQDLARNCQLHESSLCIEGVCGRLMQEVPDIPLMTIHDCWIYPEHYEPIIRASILDTFAESGLNVSLSTKYLDEDC